MPITMPSIEPEKWSMITLIIPEDILRLIFTALVDDLNIPWDVDHTLGDLVRRSAPSSAHGSLALSHVCTTWRTVAISYPCLWCAIDLAEPRLAQLCMDLSRPCNVRVFCRKSQQTHHEPLGPDCLAALESIFRESTRIGSLRLVDYQTQLTDKAYYEHSLLHIIVRLAAKFSSLTTLCGDVNGPLPSRITSAINIDALTKGASGSSRNLNLSSFCNVLSMKALRTLQLVELKIRQTSNFASADSWRRCLNHLAPTLRHLELSGDCIPT
jgi:hypothetical protein